MSLRLIPIKVKLGPLSVSESLQLHAGYVDWVLGAFIEGEAIGEHKGQVPTKKGWPVVLARFESGGNGAQVHRLANDLEIVGGLVTHRIHWVKEEPGIFVLFQGFHEPSSCMSPVGIKRADPFS